MNRILAISLFLFPSLVFAVPITWTLENVAFDDGGMAAGSYKYDADTNIFSDINVVTTLGTAYVGETYLFINEDFPSSTSSFVQFNVIGSGDRTGQSTFVLNLDGLMTNGGGAINLNLFPAVEGEGYSLEAVCGSGICTGGPTLRLISSGAVSAVPIPAAVWLFGSALAGLGWMQRKKAI